jgi:hypothetical protein
MALSGTPARLDSVQADGRGTVPEAALAAGAALFALDQILRSNAPWLGALRMRQALGAAAVCARLLRLREDEAALRDAHHLTRARDDPGPAGRLYRTWRGVATRPPRLDAAAVSRLAHEIGLPLGTDTFDRLVMGQGTSPIVAAAEMAEGVAAIAPAGHPDAEILGMMLADIVLAQKLGWTVPVPLLATAILHPALKLGPERRRPRPSDPGWVLACHAAYALAAGTAYAQGIDLARRADRLVAAAGKVRTQGRAAGLSAILADDALAANALDGIASDRAARRFLERLTGLGAVRELTGRPIFRLYGL